MADVQGAPAQDELDVDQLLSDLKEPQDARPMGGDEPAVEPQAPVWNGEEWAFDSVGKRIVPESREQILQWAQQGRNYSQRAGELNAKEKAWLKEREELVGYKDKFSSYSQVDEFAAKNPEWWKHVQESWKSREIPQGLDPSIANVLNPLQEKVSKFEEHLAQIEAEKREQAVEKDNQALDQEIASIRKSHPNIDLSAKDETGETLERRILKHAVEIQTGSFRAAFRDYLHDQLVTQAQAKGKEAVVQDRVLNAKKGLLGTSSAPVKELKPVNVKTPWNDPSLKGEALLKEMGLG
jgi:hypothetical protein